MESYPEMSPELATFTQTAIEFATWHPRFRGGKVDVTLTDCGDGSVGCGMRWRHDELGELSAGSVGREDFDAVSRTAYLIELELNRRIAAEGTPSRMSLLPRHAPRRLPASLP